MSLSRACLLSLAMASASSSDMLWVAPIKASEIPALLAEPDSGLLVNPEFQESMDDSQRSAILQDLRSIGDKAVAAYKTVPEQEMLMHPSSNNFRANYDLNEHPVAYALRETSGLDLRKAKPTELRNAMMEHLPEDKVIAVGMMCGASISRLVATSFNRTDKHIGAAAAFVHPAHIKESAKHDANVLKGFLPRRYQNQNSNMVQKCLPGDQRSIFEMLGCILGFEISKMVWEMAFDKLSDKQDVVMVLQELAFVSALALVQTVQHGFLEPLVGEVPLLSMLEDMMVQADKALRELTEKQRETVAWLQKIGGVTVEEIGMELGSKFVDALLSNNFRFQPRSLEQPFVPVNTVAESKAEMTHVKKTLKADNKKAAQQLKELGSQTTKYLVLTMFLPFLGMVTEGKADLMKMHQDRLKTAGKNQPGPSSTTVTANAETLFS